MMSLPVNIYQSATVRIREGLYNIEETKSAVQEQLKDFLRWSLSRWVSRQAHLNERSLNQRVMCST